MPFYDFQGEEIESFCTAELSHSGATGEQRVPNPLFSQTFDLSAAEEITQPKDEYDGSANFSRLPRQTKINTYLLQALLLGVFAWILDWGISEKVWEWRSSDGDSFVPVWAFVLFAVLAGVVSVRKNALKKYMSMEKSKTSRLKVVPGKTYSLPDVIEGKTEIDIENALFRIVCCNRERYQYLATAGKAEIGYLDTVTSTDMSYTSGRFHVFRRAAGCLIICPNEIALISMRCSETCTRKP